MDGGVESLPDVCMQPFSPGVGCVETRQQHKSVLAVQTIHNPPPRPIDRSEGRQESWRNAGRARCWGVDDTNTLGRGELGAGCASNPLRIIRRRRVVVAVRVRFRSSSQQVMSASKGLGAARPRSKARASVVQGASLVLWRSSFGRGFRSAAFGSMDGLGSVDADEIGHSERASTMRRDMHNAKKKGRAVGRINQRSEDND